MDQILIILSNQEDLILNIGLPLEMMDLNLEVGLVMMLKSSLSVEMKCTKERQFLLNKIHRFGGMFHLLLMNS